MKRPEKILEKKRVEFLYLVTFITATLLLNGCIATKPVNFVKEQYSNVENSLKETFSLRQQSLEGGPLLDVSDLPVYKKGTTYVYSDRTWERVENTKPGLVNWVDYRGYKSSGSEDIIFRKMQWETSTREGRREFTPFKSVFFEQPKSLWPLKIGNKFRYFEVGKWNEKKSPGNIKSYSATWHCSVKGTEHISVLAGEFDTWKIKCVRYRNYNDIDHSREIVFWNYAPEINHFVLKTHDYMYNKKPKRIELAAILPPKSVLSQQVQELRNKTIQKALEFNKRGKNAQWSSDADRISGSITPSGTFKIASSKYCRQYVEKLNMEGNPSTMYSIACRNEEKKWVVPMR